MPTETAPLLTPFESPALHLPNRVCMAPMTRGRADNPGHVPNELMVTYYRQRASAGLIITEGTHISPRANGWENVPGIHTPEEIAGWKAVTDAVHEAGGHIFCQLWHQGRMSHPDLLGGQSPLAPSAITAKGVAAYMHGGYVPGPVPEAASLDEVKEAVQQFRQAAANAIEAGFDGVEIHGANGYLVQQFLSPQANQRTDEYGGTIENRARFLFEVIEAIHEVLPPERVALRLSPSMNDMQGINIDDEIGPMYDYVVGRLNESKLAYLHFLEPMKPIDGIPYAITKVAEHFRPIYKGTLMINKGFTFETGNEIIAKELADLVSFGTLYISNPDLVERFRTGAKLAEADKETFYTPGPKGYDDYPALR
ncbi:MAG: alkene reductase [Janthinobacterium lividum]